mgnify:CR=1 FL=1
MKFNRKNIFKRYAWLQEKKRPFIISADYDGLICAAFLSHHLNWDLVGYYDFNYIWLSEEAEKQKKDIIWVDLNILPKSGKSIGGQIVSLNKETPLGFETSFNANILAEISAKEFKNKFPFSTLLLLFWLYDFQYKKNDIGKLLILHSDNTWMKIQKYSQNIIFWQKKLSDYNWDLLFNDVDTIEYDTKIDQYLYPKLIQIGAVSNFSKLTSKFLKIKSRECTFNPDWDGDVILKLFSLFGDSLNWTPPKLPKIIKRINGNRYKLPLKNISKIGLKKFIKTKKIFSYAITSPQNVNYTIFSKYHSNEK